MSIHNFVQKMKGSCHNDFLQKMKGAAPLRAIFFFQKMKGAYRADFHSKTEGALVTRYSIFFFPLLLLPARMCSAINFFKKTNGSTTISNAKP